MSNTFVVHLDVKQRGEFFFAKCAEVPGLHVTGKTAEAIRSTAMRALKDLYKRNRHMDVEVFPTDDLAELRVRTA